MFYAKVILSQEWTEFKLAQVAESQLDIGCFVEDKNEDDCSMVTN